MGREPSSCRDVDLKIMFFLKSRMKNFAKFAKDIHYQRSLDSFVKKNVKTSGSDQLILVWELGGFSAILERNAIFSIALNARGFNTHFIICDGTSEACMQRGVEQKEDVKKWKERCGSCKKSMVNTAEKYRLNYSLSGEYIDDINKKQLQELSESISLDGLLDCEYLQVRIGQLAWGSFNRYMKGLITSIQELQKEDIEVLRKYLYAALVNTYIANNIIEQLKPAAILTSHGVYVDYAPIVMVAYEKGIPVTSWASGYQKYAHYFTVPKEKNKLNLRSVTSNVWQERKNAPLTAQENQAIDAFFQDRYFNKMAHDIDVISTPQEQLNLKKELNIFNDNPIACLFTHVNWDACFDMSMMIFESANQWVVESIEKMKTLPDVNWLIRIHPGEKKDGSLFSSDDLIRKSFTVLPSNIKILWSDSVINSYSLYQLIDIGITIFGTVGVELPVFGKLIITAGEAHFSNKDFSIDAKSREEYFELLGRINSLKKLTREQIELARQYAYLYFIQRQSVLDVVDPKVGHWGSLDIKKINELLPGKNHTIDTICNSIIKGIDYTTWLK